MAKSLVSFALLICIFTEIPANYIRSSKIFQQNKCSAQVVLQESENFLKPPHCGFSKTTTTNKKAGDRVHGGQKVLPHELPWMVYFSQGCGGTLINSRWVLTAAHCFHPAIAPLSYINKAKAFINAQDCETHDGVGYCDFNAKEVDIEKVILHEQFDSTQLYNDITLVKLKETVTFTNEIQPICLPYNGEASTISLVGKEALVSGWGFTEHGRQSENLLKTTKKIWDEDSCVAFNKIHHHVMKKELQMCVGGEAGVDSCQGDSGGPLHMRLPLSGDEKDTTKPYYQIGVVSFGKSCGMEGYPGVYANVSTYIPWIQNKILNN